MIMIRILAHAKVNLCLEVLGPRDDGYHEVVTVMQALEMADELTVESATQLSLHCDEPSLAASDNLVLRAARLLQKEASVRKGARITLDKTIPVASGLGGGSADAAAALVALDRLWGVGLAREDLARLSAVLGVDVPFFLQHAGTALGTGRGDDIEGLSAAPPGWAVLLVPRVFVPEAKTAALYGLLTTSDYTSGDQARRWRERLAQNATWTDLLREPSPYNTFASVAERAFSGIREAWDEFRSVVGPNTPVSLAGSGPTLYALFDDETMAARAHADLTGLGLHSILTRTTDHPLVVTATN